MRAYSVTDVPEYLTGKTGKYLSHARVYTVVRRLADAGEIEDRRAGGRRILLDCDIAAIAVQLGFATADLAVEEAAHA